MPDAVILLGAAHEQFGAHLRLVRADQWGLPTPCASWAVRDVVGHTIVGGDMAATILGGATVPRGRRFEGPDDTLVAQWGRASGAEHAAFSEPGVLQRTVTHSVVGEIPATLFIEMRTVDALIHAWDLARAVGGDETLPAHLVEAAWAMLEPTMAVLGQSGVYGAGPSGELGHDSSLQDRLLDLTGRRP